MAFVGKATPSIEEYLAVPYKLVVEAFEAADGQWFRRASYPELPGCVAEAFWMEEAVEGVDEMRVRFMLERVERGEPIPVPRPPLRSIDYEHLHFAKRLSKRGQFE